MNVPGIALDAEHTVGPPKISANLAVFPIYARIQDDIGDFVTLDAALEKGTAVVREVGDGQGHAQRRASLDPGDEEQQMGHGAAARVDTLIIENKGDLPILVLAGTVVKGGKQDRQIGQDFIIGRKETTPVDAFCVEQGRWNMVREGVGTRGTFSTMKSLAQSAVRTAGQYERDQSKVWSKVGEVNAAHKKASRSGTLMATLDDAEVAAQREALGKDVHAYLAGAPEAASVVGFAYAVDGEVRGVRWFMNRRLFEMYRETLVNTAAVEAVTAQAAAKSAGRAVAAGATAPQAVVDFVSSVEKGRVEQRETAAENVNSYQYADDGYASKTLMKPKAASAPPGKAVTSDYTKKK